MVTDVKHGYDCDTTKTYCGISVTVATRHMVVGPYASITCAACKTAQPFHCSLCGSDKPHEPWHCRPIQESEDC